jgi:predicted metal-binding protein
MAKDSSQDSSQDLSRDSRQASRIVTLRPRRPEPILVCRKCLKRVADGKQIKRALKSEVKRRSAAQETKRPRIVLTDCFGICPKGAVVLASGTTLHRGEYVLLAGHDEIDAAAAILMHPGGS